MQANRFFYEAGLFSAKVGVGYELSRWELIWRMAEKLKKKYLKAMRGNLTVPSRFSNSEDAYLESLELEIAEQISNIVPNCKITFDRHLMSEWMIWMQVGEEFLFI